MSTALALYNSACDALTKARTLLDVTDVANKAAAIKELARLTKERPLEIQAADLRIRSERSLGKMLAQVGLHKGGRPSKKTKSKSETVSNSETVSTPTLDELGIDAKLSSRAQDLASIPDATFESRIALWRDRAERGAGRVTAKLLRDGGEKTPKKRASALKVSDWENATDDQRFAFIEAVTVAEIVDVFGAAEFYRALSEAQKDAMWEAERADQDAQESQQTNGETAHP
jgi:hypothetical protein